MDAKTLYTLIIVTYGSNVSQTPGFESLSLCQDAAQVAATGRTVAEEREVTARLREANDKLRLETKSCPIWLIQNHNETYVCKDGEVIVFGGSQVISRIEPTSIKFARCLIEPPADKP